MRPESETEWPTAAVVGTARDLARQYGVVFFLGTLYHLKNPFYALETIAQHARYYTAMNECSFCCKVRPEGRVLTMRR